MIEPIKLIALIKADPQLAVDYLQALDTIEMAESVINRPSEPKAPPCGRGSRDDRVHPHDHRP